MENSGSTVGPTGGCRGTGPQSGHGQAGAHAGSRDAGRSGGLRRGVRARPRRVPDVGRRARIRTAPTARSRSRSTRRCTTRGSCSRRSRRPPRRSSSAPRSTSSRSGTRSSPRARSRRSTCCPVARVVLGVGAGWLAEEFTALGLDAKQRFSRTEECIEVLRALWTETTPSYHGRHFDFDAVHFAPRPASDPHPPILLGGDSDRVRSSAPPGSATAGSPGAPRATSPRSRRRSRSSGRSGPGPWPRQRSTSPCSCRDRRSTNSPGSRRWRRPRGDHPLEPRPRRDPRARGVRGDRDGACLTRERRRVRAAAHARRDGTKPAVVMGATGETVTYAQLDARSNQVAQLLRAEGLHPGDHVALFLENDARYLEIVWAAQRSGLYYTPISSLLTRSELDYVVGDCGAVAVFASGTLATRAAGIGRGCPRVRVRLAVGGDLDGFEDYDATRDPRAVLAGGTGGRRERDVLQLGHHRSPQGHPPAAHPGTGLGAPQVVPTMCSAACSASTRELVYLSPGAAVPRRPRAVDCRHPAPRRHRRRDGAVRPASCSR